MWMGKQFFWGLGNTGETKATLHLCSMFWVTDKQPSGKLHQYWLSLPPLEYLLVSQVSWLIWACHQRPDALHTSWLCKCYSHCTCSGRFSLMCTEQFFCGLRKSTELWQLPGPPYPHFWAVGGGRCQKLYNGLSPMSALHDYIVLW